MFAFFGEKLKVLLKFFFWFLMDMVKFGDKKFMCIKSEKEHPIKQSTIA